LPAAKALLITRPAHQAQGLVAACEQAGVVPFVQPMLAIEPQACAPYEVVSVLIVTSANAVRYGEAILSAHQGAILAVGAATQKALEQAGFQVDFCPAVFDSEHLLAWSGFDGLKGQKVGLLKGVGGRQLIRQTLEGQGLSVIEWLVYQRQAVVSDGRVLADFAAFNGQKFVLATSQAVLEALDVELQRHQHTEMREEPLLVFSQSAFTWAHSHDWKHVRITKLADESSVMDWVVES
jgi:uroporphyrinogen-III synthase